MSNEETPPMAKTDEKPEEKTGLKEEVNKIDKELYEKRKAELTELEKKIDAKTKELNEAVDGYKAEGKALAGLQKEKTISPEQKAANDRVKEVGDATGAQWAKDMDKKDGAN